MPKYFFDSDNGKEFLVDVYGIELDDMTEAVDQAEEIVKTLIAESVMKSGSIDVAVQVRSVDGDVIHTVHGSIVSRSVTNRFKPKPSFIASSR